LAKCDQQIKPTRGTGRGQQGKISVGITPPSPFHPFVPRVIRAFRQAYPLVSLSLEESFSNELLEHLRNERIDVAFIRSPPADPQGLVINSLLNEELVVALPNNHVLARSGGRGNAALPMRALARETFIIVGSQYGLGLYAATIAAFREAGFNPPVGQEASPLASTPKQGANRPGASLVPAFPSPMSPHP